MRQDERLDVAERLVVLDRDDVRARHHHLADDRVAELEDRVDQLLLPFLDRSLLRTHLGHRTDLLLGDERPLLEPLARQEDVGEADQEPRRDLEDPAEEPYERGERERHAVGVQHGERLGHRLDEHEVQQREPERDQAHPRAVAAFPELVLREDRDEDRRPVLHEHHGEVYGVEVARRIRLDLHERLRVPAIVLLERERADARRPGERRLGGGEHGAEQHQHDREAPPQVHDARTPL